MNVKGTICQSHFSGPNHLTTDLNIMIMVMLLTLADRSVRMLKSMSYNSFKDLLENE
jgi:hypothetical protein